MATMRFLRLSTLPHFKWSCPEKNSLCNNNHNGFIKLLSRRISAKNVNVSTADIPEILALNSNLRSHKNIHDFSLTHPEHFWGTLAKSRLQWIKEFDQVMDCDLKIGKIGWFIGGQLNVTVNCVDRHAKNTPDKIALIWEKDEPGQEETITYKELYEKVNQFANTLKNHGVKRGDRVAIYLPVTPIAVIAMLACARIGAIHSVVFAGFSAESLAARIQDAKAETVITADESVRGGKKIQLKKVVDVAVAKCPFVKRVFVSKLLGSDVTMTKLDIPLEQVLDKESKECPPEVMESEDLLFLLYTSGSTGKPKGIAHSQAGYLLYSAMTHKLVFNYEEGDIFGCVADIGWITGHSYVVYGPLCNGGTSVLFESIPTYPDPGRYWETVQRLKINQFYGAPTAIRLLLKYGDDWVTKYDRSSLKTIGSVGEPINYDAWKWYYNVVGESRCPLVDTWWQTETGGITIAPQPSDPNTEIKPGMAMQPFFGIDLVLINEQGKEILTNNVTGALCIRQAWPGIARTVYKHHERFIQTYFSQYPGYYFSGDGAIRDSDGHYQITGRIDDVINVSGHRLGTAEVEYVLGNHPAVAESAVVGYPHEIKGEGIYAYVVLKDRISDSMENIIKELKMKVKSQIASYAVPDFILICNGLPKTRSGKIMRRILRKISANKPDELEDTSSLSDPVVVEILVKDHENLMKKIE